MKMKFLLTAVLGLGISMQASALVVYSGYDAGAGSLAAAPNATAAAASFDADTGSLDVVDFESPVIGFTTDRGNVTSNSGCSAALCGYNTTSGGSQFLNVYGGQVVFSFDSAIDSFGAYFTGTQINNLTLTYTDSSTEVLTFPDHNLNAGGTTFFGFSDVGATISSITFEALNDIVSIDDIRFGNAASVPEPATLLLFGSGLLGLAAARRRQAKIA